MSPTSCWPAPSPVSARSESASQSARRAIRIIRQLLTESLVLALASAVCAFAIARLVLQVTVSVVLRTLPPELAENVSITAPGTDWRVAVFLVIAAIASTVLFGLVPALQGTRLDLIRTMRGEVTRDSRPRRARNALIVVQVTASALLLICASIFEPSGFSVGISRGPRSGNRSRS